MPLGSLVTRRGGWLLELPQDVAEEAEPFVQVGLREVEMAHEAAQLFFECGTGAAWTKAAAVEDGEQDGDHPLSFSGGGIENLLGGDAWRLRIRLPDEFIERDGDGLAQVHRRMFGARGDAEEKLAVAEVVIGEADFFRSEEEGDFGTGAEAFAHEGGGGFEAIERLLRRALAAAGGANDEITVGDGVGYMLEFLRCGEDGFGVDGGLCLAKRGIVGADDAQMRESKVGHSAGGGADVEGIAAADEDDAEAALFLGCEHDGRTQATS